MDIKIKEKLPEFKYNTNKLNFIRLGVKNISRSLDIDHINQLNFLNILPDYNNLEIKIEDINEPYNHDIKLINNNIITGIEHIFGQFIDTYITRTILKLHSNYDNNNEIYLFNFLKFDNILLKHHESLRKSLIKYLYDNKKEDLIIMKDMFNNLGSDLLNNLHEKYLKNLLNLTYIIKDELSNGSIIAINNDNNLNKNFRNLLINSYNKFKDKSLESHNIMFEIFIISLIYELDRGRYAIQYITDYNHIYTDNELNWFKSIDNFIHQLYHDNNGFIYTQYYLRDQYTGISGYADIITSNEIIDIKCTQNQIPQFEHFIQLLLYLSLYNSQQNNIDTFGDKINKISIYNPLLGKKYTWDLSSWDKYTEFINNIYILMLQDNEDNNKK